MTTETIPVYLDLELLAQPLEMFTYVHERITGTGSEITRRLRIARPGILGYD